jgi:branched-chain amino acid transport system permease protein
MFWGRTPADYRVPKSLDFVAFQMFGTDYPAYKMFILLVAAAMFVFLIAILQRTRVGLIIRAALGHPQMVAMLGHNVPRVFMAVFGVGCALAGLAGVIAGPELVTQPSMAGELGPILFVVVIVGGMGSLSGAFVASLLVGIIQTLAVAINLSLSQIFGSTAPPFLGDLWTVTVAQLAPIIPYALLILVLIFRPTGLMGTRES